MDIYVKPAKKVILSGENRKNVTIADVCEIAAPSDVLPKVRTIKLFKPDTSKESKRGRKKQLYLVSITDIINAIAAEIKGATVSNVGESDTIVEYTAAAKAARPVWQWVKTCLIAFVLLVGSATAIMSFHSDAQLPEVFNDFYYIIFRERVDNPLIIEIPYAVGVAAGILVFYNHIFGKKLTDDPTPIQVEMAQYDMEVSDAIIEKMNAQKTNREQAEQ